MESSAFFGGNRRDVFHAVADDRRTAFVAARITSMTKPGWDSIGTWLLSIAWVVAPIRFARKRCTG